MTYTDSLGQKIQEGNYIAYSARDGLQYGRVVKLNTRTITRDWGTRNQKEHIQSNEVTIVAALISWTDYKLKKAKKNVTLSAWGTATFPNIVILPKESVPDTLTQLLT